MAWSEILADQITAPSDVPFVPGNNVTGFGSEVPTELAAAGYSNAIVFYASDWNPTAVVTTTKFRFIAADAVTKKLVLGFGFCTNPSVSQTAIIHTGLTIGFLSTYPTIATKWTSGNPAFEVINVGNVGLIQMFADAAPRTIGLQADNTFGLIDLGSDTGELGWVGLGGGAIYHSGGPNGSNIRVLGNDLSTTAGTALETDSSWSSFPLGTNWSSVAGYPARYRMMPDGTVMFKGSIQKSTVPVNGESVLSAAGMPAAYRPINDAFFAVSCTARPNNNQKVIPMADGRLQLWESAAGLLGDVALDGVQYPAVRLP